MLADEFRAVGDKAVGAFLFGGFAVPGVCINYFHSGVGNYASDAEEEGGISGFDFGIGIRAHITDFGVGVGNGAGGSVTVHGFELHASGDTRKISAFVDGSESVVEIRDARGVSLSAGGMAELDFGEFSGGLKHELLVAERVGEDNVASRVDQFASGVIARVGFGDVGSEQNLGFAQPHSLGGSPGGVDKVFVVSAVFVMQEYESDFEFFVVVTSSQADYQCSDNCKDQNKRQNLFKFHLDLPPLYFLFGVSRFLQSRQTKNAILRLGV